MLYFILGVVIGAAFAPFWMMVFNQAKAWWDARQK